MMFHNTMKPLRNHTNQKLNLINEMTKAIEGYAMTDDNSRKNQEKGNQKTGVNTHHRKHNKRNGEQKRGN